MAVPFQKNATTGVRPLTMSAAAAGELRRRILAGIIAPGAALRQDDLVEDLGISRIPVREALLQLEAEGLVKIVPHKGAIVSVLTEGELDELFSLRGMIEPDLLARSAPRLTASDFEELRAILADFDAAVEAKELLRWGELNYAFHMGLYQRAERPKSLLLASNLLRDCDRHTRIQMSLAGAADRAQREHRELLRLCEQGKVDAAIALLKAHIAHVAESLLRPDTAA